MSIKLQSGSQVCGQGRPRLAIADEAIEPIRNMPDGHDGRGKACREMGHLDRTLADYIAGHRQRSRGVAGAVMVSCGRPVLTARTRVCSR